jgi:hypothetical protein
MANSRVITSAKYQRVSRHSDMAPNPPQQERISSDLDLEVYTDKELVMLSTEIAKKLSHFEAENLMFDSFLNRVIPQGKESDAKEVVEQDTAAARDNTRREKKKKGPTKEENRPLLLYLCITKYSGTKE